jgi:hypothetical protein
LCGQIKLQLRLNRDVGRKEGSERVRVATGNKYDNYFLAETAALTFQTDESALDI